MFPQSKASLSVKALLMTFVLGVLFATPAIAGPGDEDGDNVPDALESEICGRPITRGQLGAERCPGPPYDNFVPPEERTRIRIHEPVFGPDADVDGIPAYVDVPRRIYDVYLFGGDVITLVGSEPGPRTALDPDDANVNWPIPYDAEERVGGLVDLVDPDHDGLPEASEPFLCSVQNDNTPDDGTCATPDNYTAPSPP